MHTVDDPLHTKQYASCCTVAARASPWLGAPPALTLGQHVGHPLAGEVDVALADPLPELARHEPHHLLVVLEEEEEEEVEGHRDTKAH